MSLPQETIPSPEALSLAEGLIEGTVKSNDPKFDASNLPTDRQKDIETKLKGRENFIFNTIVD